MNRVKFYTTEEIKAIELELINNCDNIFLTEIAENLSKRFNRPYDGLLSKIHKVKRKLIKQNLIEVDNFQYRRSINPERRAPGRPIKEKPSTAVIKPIVEQQPAEVGVEVPHGMTFEGKPKRIMLHSDHFRIYF